MPPEPNQTKDPQAGSKARPSVKRLVLVALLTCAGVLAVAHLIWPHFDSARPMKPRRNDAGNLLMIGLALRMYGGDNDYWFPPDLGQLCDQQYMGPGLDWISPKSDTPTPKSGDDIRAGLCDYVYFGSGHSEDTCWTETPIACTRPGILLGGATNVLYGDGHVKYFARIPETVQHLLNELQTDKKP